MTGGMRNSRDAGHEGWNAGKVGCRTGGMQERRNAGKEGCKIGRMKIRRDAGKEIFNR